MAAFREARALGAEGFELDVHRTADGEVVVFHDPALGRTTDGDGALVLGPDGRAREWLARDTLERMWRDHRAGNADYGPQMWSALTLESWLRDLARTGPLLEPGVPALSGDVT